METEEDLACRWSRRRVTRMMKEKLKANKDDEEEGDDLGGRYVAPAEG